MLNKYKALLFLWKTSPKKEGREKEEKGMAWGGAFLSL